jgi:glutathione S-transferase
MITLYGFGPAFGMMDASPFVVKVDLYLRIAKLDYNVEGGVSHLRRSPKGKLPFIEDDNQMIGDSAFIIEYLKNKYSTNCDEALTKEQKATAYLLSRSLEENLYWCLVYSRWADDNTWPVCKDSFFTGIPFLIKDIAAGVVRKKTLKNLNAQGIGRHSKEEVLSITEQSLQALSDILGDKEYFFNNTISSFDVTVFSILCQFILVDYASDFNQLAKKYDNLVNFCERINTLYY